MNQTEYAAHLGVSKMTVSKAIRKGRLTAGVTRTEAGGYEIDPVLADVEWKRNSDYTTAPQRVTAAPESGEVDSDSLAQSAERQKHWMAKLAELKYRQQAGELVESHEVEAKLTEVFSSCKTKLLGIPSRARQQLPHLSDADVALLTALVREALEDLAGPADPE